MHFVQLTEYCFSALSQQQIVNNSSWLIKCNFPYTMQVADRGNARIVVLKTSDGSFSHSFGHHGVSDCEFAAPVSIAVSDQIPNWIWVADLLQHRIQCLDVSVQPPRFVRQIGVTGFAGPALPKLNQPTGLVVHRGRLFVSEFGNDRVTVFEEHDGSTVAIIGGKTRGSHDGQLAYPRGLAVDAARNLLYICDYGNARVAIHHADEAPFSHFATIRGQTAKAACGVCVHRLDAFESHVFIAQYLENHENPHGKLTVYQGF
jgi:hypothetical protein